MHAPVKCASNPFGGLSSLGVDGALLAVSQEELYSILLTGVTSGATLQFFQTSFNEPAVTRLQRSLDTACSVLETLVRSFTRGVPMLLVFCECKCEG